MRSLLIYLLQLIIASGILYGYYHFFLRNKKFHLYNRYYLLIATVISVIIPFLHIPVYFTPNETESSAVLKTLKTIYYSGSEDEVIITSTSGSRPFDWNILLYLLYTCITIILFIRIMASVKKIKGIIKTHNAEELDGVHFVNTNEPGTPFSFFRWLFWNKKIELQSEKGQQIFRHEIFHIQQKHSWDVLFLEIVNTVLWINPFFHFIKKELQAIHEFLADQFATNEEEKWNYAELLLMQALQTKQHLVNPFFHNQIKRRIAMITNPQKTSHRYLRKLLVLPLAVLVITLVAFTYKNKAANTETFLNDPITIVIDAGHGGIDPGVESPDKKYKEDQLALDLAKTIRDISEEYNINVVMTREDDNLPGKALTINEGLQKRTAITKEVNAEMFISIHISSEGNEFQNTRSGFEAYISSKKENPLNQQLASSILQNISGIYNTNMTVKKRNNTGIYVLDKNDCPAVLLECGYINNLKDIAFLTDKSNQEKVARSILEAVVNYKKTAIKLNQAFTTETADTAGSAKTSTKITVDGKEFNLKELKIEDLNGAKVEAVELYTPGGFAGSDTADDPLIVIDGVKQKDNSGFKNIDPNTIESINVYKNKTAIAKYGNEGKNGVIEIITKNNPNKEANKLTEVSVVGYSNKIFEKVEIEPTFPGGENAWKKYLLNNLDPTGTVKKKAPDGIYTVIVQFIVKKDGSISDVRPLTGHGYGLEEEAASVIKEGPDWIPAIQNGHPVNAYRKQPITFVIKKGKPVTKTDVLSEVVMVGYNDAAFKNEKPNNAEKAPSFIGGLPEWRKYLERNLNPNIPINNNAPVGHYTVIVEFIVKTDGSISDIKALTNQDYGMEDEAVRIIKNSPKWQPAIQNGHPVNSYKKQPITFQVIDEKNVTTLTKTDLSKLSPIYPNPTTNSITIPFNSDLAGKGEVRITDVKGNLRIATSTNFVKGLNSLNINVVSLAKGIYIVNVVDENKKTVRTYKMVKE